MPAAIAIPLIVGAASAGGAVASAKIQSNAAKKAAGLQTASQDKAQSFNQQVYNDQRQSLNPYVQAGTGALAQLQNQRAQGGLSNAMRGTALPPGQFFTPPPPPQGPPPGVSGQVPPSLRPPMPPPMAGGAPPMPPGGPQMAQGAPMPPGGPQPPMGGGPLAAAMPTPPGMVMMEGPDGSRHPIPQVNVQEAIRRGAKVVQ